MSKYDFVKDFVEQNMQFKDFDDAQLIFFKSQVTNLGIEVGNIDEEEFNNISEKLHRIYNEIAKATINNENMEDDTMMNNNGTINEDTINNGTNGGNDMNNEEKTVAEKAGEFVNDAKDKVVEGAKKFAEDLTTIKDEAIKINKMNNADAETYIKDKGVEILNKIKSEGNKFLGKLNILSEKTPNPKAKEKLKDKAISLAKFIEIIDSTLDEENINGWGKFVEILKAVAKLILGLIIKGAAIALKLGIALVVGGIKVGATGIVLAIELFKIVKNDVVKPIHSSVSDARKVHKEYKEAKEFEEDFDEFDDMVEEAATVN